jgi:hypothetical protein
MPTPLKPCEGKLTEESQEALRRNRNREQWAQHQCETCGRTVGVEIAMGRWQPERHWPSIAYPARKTSGVQSRPSVPLPSTPPSPLDIAS